jgi:hypothetical protein
MPPQSTSHPSAPGHSPVPRPAARPVAARDRPGRDLDDDIFALAHHVDRLFVDDDTIGVQVLDKLANAAFVQEHMVLRVAFVINRDGDAGVQEGEFT